MVTAELESKADGAAPERTPSGKRKESGVLRVGIEKGACEDMQHTGLVSLL